MNDAVFTFFWSIRTRASTIFSKSRSPSLSSSKASSESSSKAPSKAPTHATNVAYTDVSKSTYSAKATLLPEQLAEQV